MTSSEQERQNIIDFGERYSLEPSSVLEEIEHQVIGGAWGANGYTTVREADRLSLALGLRGESHLLDIGSGRGWPGLYLAERTGCRVTLTDLPLNGLQLARAAATKKHINLAGGVVSSAKALPFNPASFEAIVHTDVLC